MKSKNSFALVIIVSTLITISCNQPQQKPETSDNTSVSGAFDRTILPILPHPFAGVVDTNSMQSKPDFPIEISAPKDAPNVLLIMTDDVGYGASSTFGGPISTPTFDNLAANGLRYNEFHTTALCSPTRAALISGRNHHTVASGVITEMATGFDGYNSLVPKSCASVGEILKDNGWNTGWWGKMHNVPDWKSSTSGPFDLWPNGLGFEYFYGFLGGDSHQWRPALYENTNPIEPYLNNPNYILDKDLADNCSAYIRKHNSVSPQRPFFAYYCTGTAHAPHHAPKDWIEKYKGKFDQGWDKVREETLERQKKLGVIPQNTKLTARNVNAPEWSSLSADQKKLYAHEMEVYAGALSYADYNIGRVIDAVRETGQLDNTIIIYIMGDNGASGEGTAQGTTNEVGTTGNGFTEDIPFLMSQYDKLGSMYTYNHYSYGWALAMDAPFQWCKQVASHFGGTRNGMVISYPKRIKDKGGLRSQFHHVIDIVPTILDLCGVPQPTKVNGVDQRPMDGVSMVYSFDSANAPSKRNTQYFEMMGNRAIYHDGWVAATTPLKMPWQGMADIKYPSRDFKWELYNISNDYSEAENLVDKNADKLKALQDLFYAEAKKNNVLPLDASFVERVDPSIRPSLTRGRASFEYYEGAARIPEGSAPDFKNKSWNITAEVNTDAKSQGVLATMGGYFGGFVLMLKDGRPMFMYRSTNQPKWLVTLQSSKVIGAGAHKISIDFVYDGGGRGKGANMILSVDGKEAAKGRIERSIAARFSLDETFDVGEDTGTPVEFKVYDVPFKFNGELKKVTVNLKPGS
ncbi:MAG: arylsulfatase [Chitinophagales bacterium]